MSERLYIARGMSEHTTGARRHRAREGAGEGISPNEAQGMSEMVLRGQCANLSRKLVSWFRYVNESHVSSVDITEINSSMQHHSVFSVVLMPSKFARAILPPKHAHPKVAACPPSPLTRPLVVETCIQEQVH